MGGGKLKKKKGKRFRKLKPFFCEEKTGPWGYRNWGVLDCVWNVMAHAQKPDFVFRRNGRVHLNRRVCQFSWLLAPEVRASAVVMLGTPCSEVVWRVLAIHSIRQFPLHFFSHASPSGVTFQLESTTGIRSQLKCDGTHAETRFSLSEMASPFKSAGASVQSTTGSRGVRISGSNVGYNMFRGSVKSTGYPLHSPVPFTSPPVRHRVPSNFYWSLLLVLEDIWNVMEHAQKPDFVFRRNGDSI